MPEEALENLACMEVRGGNVPADVGLAVPGLSVQVLSRPYEEAAGGGDVHFVSSCGTGRITRLLVADVAGHGADVNATARVLHGLMYRYVNHIDPRKFVENMNDAFGAMTLDGQFATAIVGTYFAPSRELSLINAGHPPPLLYRAKTQTWTLLEDADGVTETNFPLGVVAQTTYEQINVQLADGDVVICYTDSLPESRDTNGELLGYKRLLELADTIRPGEALNVWLQRWLDAIEAISPGGTLKDDLTVVLVRADIRRDRASVGQSLRAAAKLFINLKHMRAFPWPGLSVKNIGGALLPWIGRR